MLTLLTVQEVATLLRVSKRTVYRLVLQNKLPEPRKIGRSIRWHKQELLSWLEAYCPPLEVSDAEPVKVTSSPAAQPEVVTN